MRATNEPCCGSITTSRSKASRLTAAETGKRDTPSRSHRASLSIGAPGSKRARQDRLLELAVDLVRLAVDALPHGSYRLPRRLTGRMLLRADMLEARDDGGAPSISISGRPGSGGNDDVDFAIARSDDAAARRLCRRAGRPRLAARRRRARRSSPRAPASVFDITAAFATMRDLCEAPDPAAAARGAPASGSGASPKSSPTRRPTGAIRQAPWLLAPDRSAGDQGGGRHLRHLDDRAGDRGARARRARRRRSDPRRTVARASAPI